MTSECDDRNAGQNGYEASLGKGQANEEGEQGEGDEEAMEDTDDSDDKEEKGEEEEDEEEEEEFLASTSPVSRTACPSDDEVLTRHGVLEEYVAFDNNDAPHTLAAAMASTVMPLHHLMDASQTGYLRRRERERKHGFVPLSPARCEVENIHYGLYRSLLRTLVAAALKPPPPRRPLTPAAAFLFAVPREVIDLVRRPHDMFNSIFLRASSFNRVIKKLIAEL